MNELPANLVEVGEFFGQGYQPVLDFHGWRVAVLRRREGVTPADFHRVERHNETNEVFILTEGEADMILMDGDETAGSAPTDAYVFPMQKNVMYNIQQSVWHHVVLSEDAHIVLVERSNTGQANTDYHELPEAEAGAIRRRFTRQ